MRKRTLDQRIVSIVEKELSTCNVEEYFDRWLPLCEQVQREFLSGIDYMEQEHNFDPIVIELAFREGYYKLVNGHNRLEAIDDDQEVKCVIVGMPGIHTIKKIKILL